MSSVKDDKVNRVPSLVSSSIAGADKIMGETGSVLIFMSSRRGWVEGGFVVKTESGRGHQSMVGRGVGSLGSSSSTLTLTPLEGRVGRGGKSNGFITSR